MEHVEMENRSDETEVGVVFTKQEVVLIHNAFVQGNFKGDISEMVTEIKRKCRIMVEVPDSETKG